MATSQPKKRPAKRKTSKTKQQSATKQPRKLADIKDVAVDVTNPLPNTRYEAVAQARASGSSWVVAAEAGGYASERYASQLAKRPEIVGRVAHLQGELCAMAELDRDDTAQLLADQATYDPLDFFEVGPDGEERARPMNEIPLRARLMINGFEIETIEIQHDDGRIERRTKRKYKLVDRQKALDMVNRMIGGYEADNRQKADVNNVLVVPGVAPDLSQWAKGVQEYQLAQTTAITKKGK